MPHRSLGIHSVRARAYREQMEKSPELWEPPWYPSEEILRRHPEINSAWSVSGKLSSGW